MQLPDAWPYPVHLQRLVIMLMNRVLLDGDKTTSVQPFFGVDVPSPLCCLPPTRTTLTAWQIGWKALTGTSNFLWPTSCLLMSRRETAASKLDSQHGHYLRYLSKCGVWTGCDSVHQADNRLPCVPWMVGHNPTCSKKGCWSVSPLIMSFCCGPQGEGIWTSGHLILIHSQERNTKR